MSRLKELIAELCPDGVEFKTLGEIGTFTRGQGMSKEDKGKGDIPIILYGELYTTYGNYINEVFSKSSEEVIRRSPIIKKGDLLFPVSSTTKEALIGKASAYYCDYDSYLGSDAILFKHNEEPGYLVHLLNSRLIEGKKMVCVRGTTINHLDPKRFAGVKIPVPPMEIQREIVRILDKFTELGALLETELVARKKQYEYYRNKLLTFGADIPRVALGEIADIVVGGDVPKDRFSKEKDAQFNIPIFSNGVGESALYGFTDKPRISVPGVTISARGTIGYCSLRKEPFFPIIRLICAIPHEELYVNYLKYFLDTVKFNVPKTGIPQLTAPEVAKTKIPLPPLSEQKRIADILDRFDALCNDLSSGIPAEIAARKMQYEYYRDRLLTFKELGA